ncbi:50S ribosomal protein L11 [Candidatus Gugararchaeum adminiculabundum]|nr:50S ribosomal protein L11 [Candidatus Gugararchaeum adminiculabundum]
MVKIVISSLVDGGSATAGPPLGPALGPLGVNINGIIAEINSKTKDFKGTKVPVKVIVDKDSKAFEIQVGSPPASSLIKKELGIESGAKVKDEKVGNLSFEQLAKVARMKSSVSLAKDLKKVANEVLGTCVSMGVTCNGQDPRAVIKEINEGKHDSVFKGK